jgi:hypothetical protein
VTFSVEYRKLNSHLFVGHVFVGHSSPYLPDAWDRLLPDQHRSVHSLLCPRCRQRFRTRVRVALHRRCSICHRSLFVCTREANWFTIFCGDHNWAMTKNPQRLCKLNRNCSSDVTPFGVLSLNVCSLTCGLHHWLPIAAAAQRISETQRGKPVSRQQGGALIFFFQFGQRLRLKGWFSFCCRVVLTQQFRNNSPVNVGQADITTAEFEGQLFVIDAQLMQDRGVDVVDLQWVFGD